MFEKVLDDKNVRRFKYAPPLTRLDDIKDSRLPEPPYVGVPREERSVFYYWWLYLRENEDYMACCANGGSGPMAALYQDFGDIRDDKFFVWWKTKGRELFCEQDGRAVKIHHSLPEQHDFGKELLIAIPVAQSVGRALAEIEHILRRIDRMQRWQDAEARALSSTAKYKVYTNPVLTSLHDTLEIWKASQRYQKAGKKITNYALADELDLPVSRAYPENDRCAKDIKSAVISNALRSAKNLIWNVGQGRFPDDETPHPDLSAKRIKREAAKRAREQALENQTLEPNPRRRGRYR